MAGDEFSFKLTAYELPKSFSTLRFGYSDLEAKWTISVEYVGQSHIGEGGK